MFETRMVRRKIIYFTHTHTHGVGKVDWKTESCNNSALSFIVSVQLNFTSAFHRQKDIYFAQPIRSRCVLNKVGRTSMEQFWELYSTNGNILLCSCVHTIAFIDIKKRTLYQIPDAVRQTLDHVIPVVNQPQYTPQQRPLDEYHTASYRIAWSDVDFQYHTNQAQYVKIAMDAATEACYAGRLRTFEDDLDRYCIKEMKTRYAAECKQGDNVTIYTWVDNTDDCILHLQMEKQGGTVVFQAQMKFFTSEDVCKSRM